MIKHWLVATKLTHSFVRVFTLIRNKVIIWNHRDGKEDAISIFEESIEKYCQRQDYLYLAVPDSEGGVTWYGRGFKGEYHSDTSFHGFEKLEIIIMQLRLIIDQIKNLKELGYNREDAEKFFRKCKYALSDNELNQWVSRHWRI